ncbi:MAG: leucyl aminopeptidase [Rhodobacteraceae bacterium]|nr:leucyl aminopeptidase [Paracoccaceae bacterium]
MTRPVAITFATPEPEQLVAAAGKIAVLAEPGTRLDPAARRIDRAMRGALTRALESAAFGKLEEGQALTLSWPAGLAAEAVVLVRLPRKTDTATARKAGATLGKALGAEGMHLLAASHPRAAEIVLGLSLRAYAFTDHRSRKEADEAEPAPEGPGPVTCLVRDPDAVRAAFAPLSALAEGVFLTRDLVSEPANILTTTEFAARLEGLREIGVEVEVLDEARLRELGMGALLGVGQGSDSPSCVVVMQWRGGEGDETPLALIGKGVVFDTGGISIKPAAGMEDMTMDMGGAGVVAGVMKALALRSARANVVGLVGLVENMPSGNAQRPGDVVRSMKGDTIEVINTDAEGRLVLADVMWYAQERFAPAAMVDLATLTGAIIIALGHENTGVFSNDDAFCADLLKACAAEGEGAWRMPLGKAYDKMLKSDIADMKNVGGRAAGSITAAQFLQRFVREGTAWVHLDIAGTCKTSAETALAPKGASGWGVLSLDRLVRDRFEKDG